MIATIKPEYLNYGETAEETYTVSDIGGGRCNITPTNSKMSILNTERVSISTLNLITLKG